MRIAALISGGKDSIYTLCQMIDDGHNVVCAIYILNKQEYVDSFMYQTVGNEMIQYIEQALEIDFIYKETTCEVKNTDLDYKPMENDEVEDLFEAIREAKEKYGIDGVCSGAILSQYQRNRVQNICNRLKIESFTPLWQKNQKELLNEMILYGIEARLVKIASPVINKTYLNRTLEDISEYFEKNHDKMSEINYCGEGGEYETVVFDCKHYKKKIQARTWIKHIHPEDKNKNEDEQVVYCSFDDIEMHKK
ncbi:DPH6 [Enterospora canceri]|uniref:Diphthine--ammonia ligase n=1 Tax=Enterospora canceri TaxID=1081671 RepID=A0A1Y1S6V7_9MICR|nr:DPH6 [Enterospora canceri]